MKNIKPILMLLAVLISGKMVAQHTYMPINSFSNHMIDRFEIKSGIINNEYFHTTTKSYRRQSIADFANNLYKIDSNYSKQDLANIKYLLNDNFEWANKKSTASKKKLFKEFYKQKAALFSVQVPDFNLVVNPVFNYQVSSVKFINSNALINNRGIEIRGNITDRIGFYTHLSDEIYRPLPVAFDEFERTGVLQGIGFLKSNEKEFNFSLASGFVSYSPNKYMDFQLGHGRQFIGDGVRTFILSNNAVDNFYMRLNTRIWKLNYTNIFSEYRDYNSRGYGIQNRHYSATHHLSVNVGKKLNIGIFETIIFQRDSGYNNTGFEINYLNPIIMYKSIENSLNSTDKAVLGTNFKYNFAKHFSLYGQLVISEFVFNEITNNKGWWGNKWAHQLGLKYIDVFGIDNLDMQAEINTCRPYMYTSYSSLQTFTNYNQPLAHPLGANFREYIGVLRYQPIKKLFLQAKAVYYNIGYDSIGGNENFGQNIALSYNGRTVNDYGNEIGQGRATRVLFTEFNASYMIKHNVFFDLGFTYRSCNSTIKEITRDDAFVTVGVRVNMARREYDR